MQVLLRKLQNIVHEHGMKVHVKVRKTWWEPVMFVFVCLEGKVLSPPAHGNLTHVLRQSATLSQNVFCDPVLDFLDINQK